MPRDGSYEVRRGDTLYGIAFRHGLDYREVAGQLPRIFAALLFSKIWVPIGNTGRSRVSAFKPMPVPEEPQTLLADDK